MIVSVTEAPTPLLVIGVSVALVLYPFVPSAIARFRAGPARRPPSLLRQSVAAVVNVGMAAGLVLLAAGSGLDARAMGIQPLAPALEGAARWGGPFAAVIVAGGLIGSRLAKPRWIPRDRRSEALSPAGVMAKAAVILVGTASAEEVAFRGVLFGLWRALVPGSLIAAIVGTSVTFGLWHVLPELDRVWFNEPRADRRRTLAAVRNALLTTTAGGVLFALLRLGSGGIAAPVLVHWSANVTAVVVARHAATRRPTA